MKTKKLSTEEFFDKVSNMTFLETSKYKFAKNIDYGSDKYRSGVVKSLIWISELSVYYLQNIKQLKREFLSQINKKEQELHNLNNGDFKNGILDGIKIAKEIINSLL